MADLEALRIRIDMQTRDAENALRIVNQQLKEQDKALYGAAKAAKEHSKEVTRSASSHRQFAKWVKGTATEINSIMSILGRFSSVIGKVFDMVEDAARTQAARKYFEDAGGSLERLREVSKGMISDANLIKKSNLAESMGLGKSTFENLIQVAQAASAKTGQSFDHMFDSIVLGTARSSRLLLDNLGIIVNVGEANRAWAQEAIKNYGLQGQSVQQVVGKMSDQAKKQAFLLELEKQSAKQKEQLNRLGNEGVSTFDRFAASIDNLRTAFGVRLLPMLTSILDTINEIIDGYNITAGNNAFFEKFGSGGLGRDTVVTVPGIGEIRPDWEAYDKERFGKGRDTGAEAIFAKQFAENAKDIAEKKFDMMTAVFRREAEKAGWSLKTFQELLAPGTRDFADLWDSVSSLATPEVRALANNLLEANKALGVFKGAIKEKQGLSQEEALGGNGGGGGGGKNKKLDNKAKDLSATVEMLEKLDKFNKDLDTISMKAVDDWLKARQTFQRVDRENAEADAKRRANDMAKWLDGTRKAFDKDLKQRREMLEAAQKKEAEMKQLDADVAGGINAASGLVSGSNSAFIATIASGIGAAFGAPQIGSAIGNLLGPFMEGLTGLTGIVKPLMEGFAKLIELVLGPVFDALEPLGPALYTLLAAIGILVAAAIRPFLNIINLVVSLLVFFVDVISAALIVLSPFVEIVATLISIFWTLGLNILALFIPMGTYAEALTKVREAMVGFAIGVNNAITMFMRSLGLKSYGKMLRPGDALYSPGTEEADLAGEVYKQAQLNKLLGAMGVPEISYVEKLSNRDPLDDNTEATEANTEAVRDLARELHNLPSGYRGAAAIFAASNLQGNGSTFSGRNDAGIADRTRNPAGGGTARVPSPKDPRPFKPWI